MSTLVKYWQRILQMDKDDLVRVRYDWQINNAQYDSWAKKLEKKLNKIGLGHICGTQPRIRGAQYVTK
jgi:hypothetical protein